MVIIFSSILSFKLLRLSCGCISPVISNTYLLSLILYVVLSISGIPICPYRKTLQKWLIYSNSKPTAIIEFDSLESIFKGISEGLGISLLPKSILPKNNNFFIYDLNDKFSKLEVKFIINKNLRINPLLKNFINIANSYLSSSY